MLLHVQGEGGGEKMKITDKKREEAIRSRVHRLVDDHKVALSAIALRSGVEQGAVKALYNQNGVEKRKISEATAKKLDDGMDAIEAGLGLVKRCAACGKELPFGMFHADRNQKDGLRSACKECTKAQVKARKTRKQGKTAQEEDKMNNNTENAITAETVRKVKAEDKREVESKFMAPYFKLTPKQLDEIRKGMWDKLLLTPEKPKRADSVLSAVEALRDEIAGLRREVEAVMIELGCEMKAE